MRAAGLHSKPTFCFDSSIPGDLGTASGQFTVFAQFLIVSAARIQAYALLFQQLGTADFTEIISS